MDPVTALQASSAIIQLVDFAVCLVSKSKEIHDSVDGVLDEYNDINIAATGLSARTSNLKQAILPTSVPTALSDEDQAIHGLCQRCMDISAELQTALERLRLHGPSTKWKSVRKALKSIWKKEQIEGLVKRLSTIKAELDSHVLVSLRSRLDILSFRQSEGFASLENATKDLYDAIVHGSATVLVRLEEQTAMIDTSISTRVQNSESNVIGAVSDVSQRSNHDHALIQTQISQLQLSSEQQGKDAGAISTQILDAVMSSDDQSRVESKETRAELTRAWKSAEDQISQLREEVKQLESRLTEAVRQAVSNNGRADDKKQRKLNEQTNILYKLWVAKDLMLQKLLVRTITDSAWKQLLTVAHRSL